MPLFPDWEGKSDFVRAYRDAVRTRSRLVNRLFRHPVVVLRTGPGEADQTFKALEQGLRRESRRRRRTPVTPYAYINWPDGEMAALITAIADRLARTAPYEAGRLKLPMFDLMRAVAGRDEGRPEDLPDKVFARYRSRAITAERGVNADLGSYAVMGITVPANLVPRMAERVYRRFWQWRRGRSLAGDYYVNLWEDDFTGERTYAEALDRLVRALPTPQWNELLLQALLVDLHAYGRRSLLLLPGRRRRRLRRVLLLNGTDPGGSTTVDAFIDLYRRQQRNSPNPATLLIAALPPLAADARAAAGTQRFEDLGELARKLNTPGGETPKRYEVELPGSPRGGGVEVPVVWRPVLSVKPRTELACEAALALVGLWLGGVLVHVPYLGQSDFIGRGPIFGGVYEKCLEGSVYQKSGTLGKDESVNSEYDDAVGMIEEGNKEADSKPKNRVVTIAHIGSMLPEDSKAQRAGGSVPDLRGLAMAQRQLNGAASTNPDLVWVRIERHSAGVQFEYAVAAAQAVVDSAKTQPNLIGVTGFTESRKTTVKALEILNKAKIPIMTSTATAEAMEVGSYYHGVAPSNEREVRIIADFIKKANTVRTGDGTCVPAKSVAVVTDPSDVYSDELGKKFVERFGSTGPRIGFTPDGDESTDHVAGLELMNTVSAVAKEVCKRVGKNPRTVVYWTSRVRELQAFLDEFQKNACPNQNLTVVGGNELTNAALANFFSKKSWLTLYHTAHVLPTGSPERNRETVDFQTDYENEFGSDDLWRNDGHVALAYDAVEILAQAASIAYTQEEKATRVNVQSRISGGGLGMQGASGRLQFNSDSSTRPENKMLLVLHHRNGESATVLMCGDSGSGEKGTSWKQGDKTYTCPEDGDWTGSAGGPGSP